MMVSKLTTAKKVASSQPLHSSSPLTTRAQMQLVQKVLHLGGPINLTPKEGIINQWSLACAPGNQCTKDHDDTPLQERHQQCICCGFSMHQECGPSIVALKHHSIPSHGVFNHLCKTCTKHYHIQTMIKKDSPLWMSYSKGHTIFNNKWHDPLKLLQDDNNEGFCSLKKTNAEDSTRKPAATTSKTNNPTVDADA